MDPAELVDLLFGFVHRCAVHSAGYTTDYFVSDGIAALMGGARWQMRAMQAARAGYWARDERGGWLLVDDSENLFHIRLRAEIDWERQRKRDNSNPALIVPVRLRDGDGCRWCGHIVQWSSRRGNRAGTYDHRTPGQPAEGPDDLVVACGRCNSQRGVDPDADLWLLLPAPAQPFYGEHTAAMLDEHGHTVPASTKKRPAVQAGGVPQKRPRPASPADPASAPPAPPRPATQADPAPAPPGDPATGRTTPPATPPPAGHRAHRTTSTTATPPPAGHRATRDRPPRPTPPHRPPPAETRDLPRSADTADRQPSEPGSPGRDGTGSPTTPTTTNRSRRRRGRRGRPPHPAPPTSQEGT